MDIIILATTCLINISLGVFVLFQNRGARVNSTFGLLAAFLSVWVLSSYLTNNPLYDDIAAADIAQRIAYFSATLAIFAATLLTYFYPVDRRPKKSETILFGLATFAVAGLSLTTLVSGGVSYGEQGQLIFTTGELIGAYLAYFLAAIALIIRNLLFPAKSINQSKKRQARIVMAAIIATAGLGLIFNVIIPVIFNQWQSTEYGPLATVILVGSISYLIARHGLFDVQTAAVRTVGYVSSLAVITLIYFSVASLLSVLVLRNQSIDASIASPINAILAIFLALVFQPIKSFFDRWSNQIFYRDSYKVDEFYARLSTILSSTIDLRSLLEQASKQIASTLKSSQAFFYIFYDQEVEHHMSAGTHGHTRMLMHDVTLLKDFYLDHSNSLLRTELLEEGSALQRLLNAKNITIVLPLHQNGRTIGYLFLGEQLGSGYSARDIGVLSTISNELVIAIQNALSLQEVRDLNATLQQRILAATVELRSSNSQLKHLDEVKDEFISMASHQLRTPLTSIKGYLSMVLEGDVGNISAQQRSLLHEAFKSSERMVRLITDFLNVSRLQTGKFILEKALFDLSEVVKQELENLSVIAKNRNLSLRLVGADGPLPVFADESKIRQVIMNYVDNAIYYSRPNGTIVIKLESTKKDVSVSVIDTGIGVPHSEQEKLFKKFYRAPNARKQRPDGTGVGLFLARRVVEEHKGKIIFSSKEGKGSTFGFSLPLADALTSDLVPDEAPQEVAKIAQ